MKNPDLHIVILAGGSGTRFWPLSRPDRPKQFLKILGDKTLFQMTIERVLPLVEAGNIWIVTNQRFLSLIQEQCRPSVPRSQILCEPSGKNTAPAICWAASRIHQRNKNAVMAVLPSDHLIRNQRAFVKHVRQAVMLARSHYLVTMGIVPTRPETGYGYLKIKPLGEILRVQQFTEKPSYSRAKAFIKTKKYLWNSGMFVWRVDTILAEFQKHLPKIYRSLAGSLPKRSRDFQKMWDALPSISIDYGILEKAERVAAVPAGDMGWSDVGSWQALWEVASKDQRGNATRGRTITIDCKDTVVRSDHRLVAAIGLQDFVVIDTHDALLICPRSLCQRVREVVARLDKA